jgi:hypothetical protein
MELGTLLSGSFLREAISRAIGTGIPASYFAYLLILPLLASLIAAARHLLGLTVHGTFMPAMVSLAWLVLGLEKGIILSVFLYFGARLSRQLIKKTMISRFRIDYLPRMALLLLMITFGGLVLVLWGGFGWFFASEGRWLSLLVLFLITHNLMEAQMTLSKKESRALVIESAIFALLGFILLSWSFLHLLVLSYPGWALLLILVFNVIVGRYSGFRFLEYRRFRSIVEKK